MLAEHDAALLIGDIALARAMLRRAVAGRGQPYVFDLATEWQAWTGLPFVFAVWAARADRAEAIAASGVVEAAARVQASAGSPTWNVWRARRLHGLIYQQTVCAALPAPAGL